jgi:hypothetical protein
MQSLSGIWLAGDIWPSLSEEHQQACVGSVPLYSVAAIRPWSLPGFARIAAVLQKCDQPVLAAASSYHRLADLQQILVQRQGIRSLRATGAEIYARLACMIGYPQSCRGGVSLACRLMPGTRAGPGKTYQDCRAARSREKYRFPPTRHRTLITGQ